MNSSPNSSSKSQNDKSSAKWTIENFSEKVKSRNLGKPREDWGKWVWENDFWATNLFEALKKNGWCDRATIRICGDQWTVDANKDATKQTTLSITAHNNLAEYKKSQTSEEESIDSDKLEEILHRALLIHFGYARPSEGKAEDQPLTRIGVPEAFQEKTIEIWTAREPSSVQVEKPEGEQLMSLQAEERRRWDYFQLPLRDCDPAKLKQEESSLDAWTDISGKWLKNSDPNYERTRPWNLNGLGIRSWVWLPLYHWGSKRLVGVLTLDKENSFSDSTLPILQDMQELLPVLANVLAHEIDAAFTKRKEVAAQITQSIMDQYANPIPMLRAINIAISQLLDNGFGRVWFCDFFRRKFDLEELDGKKTLSRWYPPYDLEFEFNPATRSQSSDPNRQAYEESLAAWVLSNRKSVIVHNLAEIPQWDRLSVRPIRSMIAVPLLIDTPSLGGNISEVYGLFTINAPNAGVYCFYDRDLVEHIVGQIRRILARAVVHQAVYDANLRIQPFEEHSDLLVRVLDAAIRLTSTEVGTILLFSEIERDSVAQYYVRKIQLRWKRDQAIGYTTLGQTVPEQFVNELNQAAAPMTISSSQTSSRWHSLIFDTILSKEDKLPADLRNTLTSAMVSPLRSLEHTIGLCIVWKGKEESSEKHIDTSASSTKSAPSLNKETDHPEPARPVSSPFSGIHEYALHAISERAAVAIQTEQQSIAEAKLEEAIRLVMQSQSLVEALQIIAEMARELVHGTVAFVALLHPNGRDIRLPAINIERQYCLQEIPILRLEYLKSEREMGITGRVIRDRKYILIPKIPRPPAKKTSSSHTQSQQEEARVFNEFIKRYPEYHYTSLSRRDDYSPVFIQSELVVPILLPRHKPERVPGEATMGALNVGSLYTGAFSDTDRQTIARFAQIAAMAIDRHNRPPNSMAYQVKRRAKYYSDLFVALKFSPPARRAWVEKQIDIAARGMQIYTGFKLITKSADVTGRIGEEVWSYIALCEAMIADISGESPNVLYEIGLGHSLNKDVIIIKDSKTKRLADLGDALYTEYEYEPDAGFLRQEMFEKEFQLALRKQLRNVLPKRNYFVCDVDGYIKAMKAIKHAINLIPPAMENSVNNRRISVTSKRIGISLCVLFRSALGKRIRSLYLRTVVLSTLYIQLISSLRVEGIDRQSFRQALGKVVKDTDVELEKKDSLISLISMLSVEVEAELRVLERGEFHGSTFTRPEDEIDFEQEVERNPKRKISALRNSLRLLNEIDGDLLRLSYEFGEPNLSGKE